jgi:hypothetical protein
MLEGLTARERLILSALMTLRAETAGLVVPSVARGGGELWKAE